MQSNAGSRGRVGILDVETRPSRRVGSAATVERSISLFLSVTMMMSLGYLRGSTLLML